jgi:hypothetical protein
MALRRLRCVLAFLSAFRLEIEGCGLTREAAVPLVREEFLEYLLGSASESDGAELPHTVLIRFLDAWSHRWM